MGKPPKERPTSECLICEGKGTREGGGECYPCGGTGRLPILSAADLESQGQLSLLGGEKNLRVRRSKRSNEHADE